MRENFQLMRTLATHTRVTPESRINKLMDFNRRLRQESAVIQEFRDWNMTLDRNLVEVPGRMLPSERLIFGNNTINSGQGDWTRSMQKLRLLQSMELRHWYILGCERDRNNIEVSNNLH